MSSHNSWRHDLFWQRCWYLILTFKLKIQKNLQERLEYLEIWPLALKTNDVCTETLWWCPERVNHTNMTYDMIFFFIFLHICMYILLWHSKQKQLKKTVYKNNFKIFKWTNLQICFWYFNILKKYIWIMI